MYHAIECPRAHAVAGRVCLGSHRWSNVCVCVDLQVDDAIDRIIRPNMWLRPVLTPPRYPRRREALSTYARVWRACAALGHGPRFFGIDRPRGLGRRPKIECLLGARIERVAGVHVHGAEMTTSRLREKGKRRSLLTAAPRCGGSTQASTRPTGLDPTAAGRPIQARRLVIDFFSSRG